MKERLPRLLDVLVVAVCAAYIVRFAWLQTLGLMDRYTLEWDARAMALPAWRYHGTGLFAEDYVVDYVGLIGPPLWKLTYWVGTLFTDPYTLSKLLPFALLAILVWQGFALGRHVGGVALGAATAFLLVHCTVVWDRLLGGSARSFGFPLVVAFLRYAVTGQELRLLAALLLQAATYPSAFLFSAPAYGLSLLVRPERRRWIRLIVTGAVAGLLMVSSLWSVDARFGHPTTLAEAATLPQMGPNGAQPFYPLWPTDFIIKGTLDAVVTVQGTPVLPALQRYNARNHHVVLWGVIGVLVVLAGRRLRELPLLLVFMFIASLGAYQLARVMAYRLYLPERMLLYAWPPLFHVTMVLLAYQAMRRLGARWAGRGAAILLIALQFAVYGDGLPRRMNLWDWSAYDTPTVRFIGTLPKDALVAAPFKTSSFIQYLALRRTLFSSITNTNHYYGYAVENERRIRAYYEAYYARDLETVRRFAAMYHVDYMVVDALDFGPDALRRSRYTEPWTTLAQRLIAATPPDRMALAHPPPGAVVFRDGTMMVIDLKKL
ncbi:MAG TPA: hypothetical protein VH877_02115 [Polyangia bacterium]|nr:hypothetical protein [Polyangia bacterium]